MWLINNVRTWNAELAHQAQQKLWGKRTVVYFVFDPITNLFAPAKLCAYTTIKVNLPALFKASETGMTIATYASLDESESRFDGTRAHTHLTRHLSMQLLSGEAANDLLPTFERWLDAHRDLITLHSRGPNFIVPPMWFYKKRQSLD